MPSLDQIALYLHEVELQAIANGVVVPSAREKARIALDRARDMADAIENKHARILEERRRRGLDQPV